MNRTKSIFALASISLALAFTISCTGTKTATEQPASIPATEQPASTPATEQPASTPATEQPASIPATEQPVATPVAESSKIEWTASSTLAPQGQNRYDAKNLQSTDSSIAWCEGVKGQGIGERVNAQITGFANTHVKSLVIVNGYAKNQTTWQNNSRIKKLRLYANGKHLSDFPLSDNINPQTIQLSETLPLSQNKLDLSFEIMEVYPGSKFDDLCITGISFDIYTADSRDTQIYRIVKIGNQTWMAQNLNFNAPNSLCYGNDVSKCSIFGRLYKWDAAMKACPEGWRLPTLEDWKTLIADAGSGNIAGKKLKAKAGWNNYHNANDGTDDFGFSAIFGGSANSTHYSSLGTIGNWWTSAEYGSAKAYYMDLRERSNMPSWMSKAKDNMASVRCVKETADIAVINADYSFALKTFFAKGTLGATGKTRPIEMLFQNAIKNGSTYSIIGKSKTNVAEDAFSGTLSISNQIAGGSCKSDENEINGSYYFREIDSKTSGDFIGNFIACEKNDKLTKASFKGDWEKHSTGGKTHTGGKTPCNFEF